MPTRPAAGNQDPQMLLVFYPLLLFLLQSISRVIFSSTPMLASVIKSEVPPEEINGSGIPFVGSSASTTLILKNACIKIAVVIPNEKNSQSGRAKENRPR